MRLLDFSKDEPAAKPRGAAPPTGNTPLFLLPVSVRHATRRPGDAASLRGKTATHPALNVIKPPRHRPIDLEQLQQRIEFLERRMRDPAQNVDMTATATDVDRLKQRFKRFELRLEEELSAARLREEKMLEAVNRPPLKIVLKNVALRFWYQGLPAIRNALVSFADEWWKDNQPGWWPQFARAWQEALDKARS